MLFRHIDPRQFAALRIVMGCFALLTLVGLFPDSTFHFSDDGWFPVRIAIEMTDKRCWTILHAITSSWGVGLFFLVLIASAICMIVGYRSRLSTFICFVGFASLRCRNWFITYGGDDVLRLMLFYLAMAPVGAAWSIDAFRRRSKNLNAPSTVEV